MRIPCRSSALLLVLCWLLAGCGSQQSEQSPKSEPAKPAPSQAAEPQSAPAPQTKPQAASAEPAKKKPEATSTEPAKPAAAEPAKPAPASAEPAQPAAAPPSAPTPVAQQKKAAPKDVVILKGAPMGGVKFEHKLHAQRAGNKCETCHHASRPEKPAQSAQQACRDCHTKPLQAGMKTGLPAAFHNAAAQAGTCIDCHKAQNAQGKKSPTKCLDCHKKENT